LKPISMSFGANPDLWRHCDLDPEGMAVECSDDGPGNCVIRSQIERIRQAVAEA